MIECASCPSRLSRLWVAVLAGSLWLSFSFSAWATWKSTPLAPELALSTATLEPPGNPSAVNGNCIAGISISVDISWSATGSEFAQGYEILRSTTAGGPYNKVGSVTGLGTTTFIDGTAQFGTTYHYVVRATKNNWRSVNSTESSLTTLASLCS